MILPFDDFFLDIDKHLRKNNKKTLLIKKTQADLNISYRLLDFKIFTIL